VIEDVPVFVSLVAVIVTGPPAATAVTRPFASTVAEAVLLELHVTTRPLSTLPFASFVTAVSCCVGVIPSTRLAEDGVTVTALTGASVTVIEDVPVFVSLVAVIVVAPAPTAVTRPLPSTVAAARLLDVHVTTRPVNTLLAASRSVAVSCCVGVIPTTKLADDGVTVTVFTGTGLTVITGVVAPGADSLVAVIVAVPVPIAVTVTVAPLVVLTELVALTASTAALLETQLTVRPESVLLPASFGIAVNTCVPPTTIGVAGAERATVATGGGLTVSVALPVLPSLMAMICTEPAATAVTTPEEDTVATAEFRELQETLRPVRMLPLESRVVAVACVVCPTVIDVEARETVTSATGTGTTATEEAPVIPSLVAVIVALPSATAVTKPLADTLAIDGALDDQVTVRPLRTLLLASLVSAASWSVEPMTTLADEGLTITAETLGITVSVAVPV